MSDVPIKERVASINRLTLEMADKMLEAAAEWAIKCGTPCSIAIVDDSGTLIAFHKMDNARLHLFTPDVAISKASTAGSAGVSTYFLSRLLDPRQMGEIVGTYYLGLLTQLKGRLNMIPGGEPVRDENMNVIGAIGVSGAPDGIGEGSDQEICEAGIAALYK